MRKARTWNAGHGVRMEPLRKRAGTRRHVHTMQAITFHLRGDCLFLWNTCPNEWSRV